MSTAIIDRKGLAITAGTFLIWGVVPLYWHLLKTVPSFQIIAHRIVWSAVLVMSGAVGYTLQVIGQRDTDPTVASLLMCLEAVFAVLTGAVLLGEKMTAREAAGCVMMFAAVILAQLSPVISSIRRNGRSHR